MTSQAVRAMQSRDADASTAEWQRRHAESKGKSPAVVAGTKHGNPHHGSEFSRVLHGTVPATPSGRHSMETKTPRHSADVPNRANDSTRAPFGSHGAQHPLSYQNAPLPGSPAVERNHTQSTLRGGYQHTGFEAGAL